ncbi:MAG: DUF4384 domain-containing protein [Deltaproteobacteria bacterium]|nr:DUF4384 domain-containing protein [Deltaproteobacteria bacterium]
MKKILFIIAFLLIPITASADKPVWVTADGESYQGEMDTPKEVRNRAKRDAENKAVEKAVGTFIKSHTLVSNSQLVEDLIYAAVRGKIANEEIISSNWDAKERNLYKVTIRALVEPVYPEKGEGLSAKIHLSKTNLKEGDEVQVFYQVSKDSYVYIFSIAADGSVTLLFPNTTTPDNFTKAGEPYQFPPAESSIHLKAMFLPNFKEVSAEERIKIIATLQKEELLPLGFREGIFQVYDAKSTGMISDLVRRLNQIEPTDWTEATSVYILRR